MSIRPDTRTIKRRIIVKGDLVLTSPAVFSNGENESSIDMMILRDSFDPTRALLPGSSLAGALRDYLRSYTKEETLVELFGSENEEKGGQSLLLISDAISTAPIKVELRDGVKIEHTTRIAADKAKYDLEVLATGTVFALEFELVLLSNTPNSMITLTLDALTALQRGNITFGMKKQRGLGACELRNCLVWDIDMTKPATVLKWLNCALESKFLTDFIQDNRYQPSKQPNGISLTATFNFEDDALLIRSAPQTGTFLPDDVHLQSRTEQDKMQPVIPGTSWAGVIRHRAVRILNTLLDRNNIQDDDHSLISKLFGDVREKDKHRTEALARASRILLKDSIIVNSSTEPLVQNRIAIDRFTGSAYDGALFSDMPVWKNGDVTEVTLNLSIKPETQTNDAEVGLILLLLKDLWTGDLPVGGTSSIGRGRLKGKSATLVVDDARFEFRLDDNGHLQVDGSRETLQTYVDTLSRGEPSHATR